MGNCGLGVDMTSGVPVFAKKALDLAFLALQIELLFSIYSTTLL